jgi:hypothetical protein
MRDERDVWAIARANDTVVREGTAAPSAHLSSVAYFGLLQRSTAGSRRRRVFAYLRAPKEETVTTSVENPWAELEAVERRRLLVLVGVLAVALAITLMWALGGLQGGRAGAEDVEPLDVPSAPAVVVSPVTSTSVSPLAATVTVSDF